MAAICIYNGLRGPPKMSIVSLTNTICIQEAVNVHKFAELCLSDSIYSLCPAPTDIEAAPLALYKISFLNKNVLDRYVPYICQYPH